MSPAADATDSPDLPWIHDALFSWYERERRPLAFRDTRDPYAVLVSEVMAQQTQIGRVEEAWRRFMLRFPTVEVLAAAPTADVLRAWQGLGYNRRALNLRQAAIAIVALGRFPTDVDALTELPGIGPYTARAVAAIAFGRQVAAVDVNVGRVVGRFVAGDPGRLRRPELQRAADELVPAGRSADWTHALMDLGSLVCRAGRPSCEVCPLAPRCVYLSDVERRLRARAGSSRPRTAGAGRTTAPFPSTRRWLRGRIVERLRASSQGEFVRFDPPVGLHPADDVRAALRDLAREGLVEVDATDPLAARLPLDGGGTTAVPEQHRRDGAVQDRTS